ncbi:MAG: 3-dehydroquinate synthase [Acidobacteriota bacterium]
MTTVMVPSGGESYPYLLEESCLSRIDVLLAELLPDSRFLVVSDENVGPLYGRSVAAQLGAPWLELPAGEKHKGWVSVEKVVRWLIGRGAERSDVVVAVGGGVLTDIVGFAAAVTLRGIPWVAVPTTLLAMVDAAVGGKTGVDLDLGKNLIGCFWSPAAVIADPLALTTLEPRQVRAGLAEVLKAAIISPSTLEHLIDTHLEAAAGGDVLRARDLILVAVRVKAEIVALDERERGPRATLNLGHTVGHALEAATGYGRFLHGEAVAWGLLAVLRLARDRGLLATAEAQTWAARLQPLAPLPDVAGLGWAQLAPFLGRDKKRGGGEVRWVLPRFGGVVAGVAVPEDEIARVWSALSALSGAGPFDVIL